MSHDVPPPPGGAPADNPLAGILLLIAAMAIVPGLDGIAKYLSASYPTLEIVWARFFFHLALLAPIVLWRYRLAELWPPRPLLQLARGGLLLSATICFFAALRTLPIADTLAIFFVSPMLVTILSALILKEQVGVRRWSACVIGFIGVAIIIRPGAGMFQAGAAFAIGAGLSYALYVVATRRLSRSAPPLVTLAFTAVIGAIAMTAAMPFVWVTPALPDIGLMAGLGLIAAIGHYLLIRAYEQAPASLLAPYGYTEIVSATLIGYVVFGDFPDSVTWVGIAIVISGGVYLSIRERRRSTSKHS